MDIVTINAIFIGFSFTSLSLLLGLGLDSGKTKIIEDLERIDELEQIFRSIYKGFFSGFVSIVCALLNVFNVFAGFAGNFVSDFITAMQITFLITTMFCFLRSAIDVKDILSRLRRTIRKKTPSPSTSETMEIDKTKTMSPEERLRS